MVIKKVNKAQLLLLSVVAGAIKLPSEAGW